jgi:ABC-2 type transport system permease protein
VTTPSTSLEAALARKVPPMGGFSVAVWRIEVRRLLRNRRTMIIAIAMPVIFFLTFGLNSSYATTAIGRGNVSAFVMISMALYGAVYATASRGATVSIERASGWSRQLRVTPLTPAAYISIKMLTALVLGAGSVVAVYVTGALTHKASMPLYLWIVTALCAWIGSLLFAALGLFMGYMLPAENVMQVIGLVLTVCSFLGGLFIPLSQFPIALQRVAAFTPLWGLNQLVHYPLVQGTLEWEWVLNLLVWLALLVAGAIWRFRRDTARV